MRSRFSMLVLAVIVTVTLRSDPAAAGCGCNKPLPTVALVRPAFASPGDTVKFFPPDNKSGKYDVEFESGDNKVKIKDIRAVYQRDLANGAYKWQVVVTAPQLQPGPTAIEVKGDKKFKIPSSAFTMMQPAIALLCSVSTRPRYS